jgi:hypothetical protein
MMTSPYAQVRDLAERDFPEAGTPADRLRFALRYAILAPSGHNGQPWLFRLEGGLLEVRADRARALPTIDPEDRELLISCAATVHLVRVALRHFGCEPEVAILPDAGDRDLLATFRIRDRLGPPTRPDPLFDAIVRRHSNRRPFAGRAIPAELLDRLRAAADEEGAWVRIVDERDRMERIGDLIAEGDLVKWREPDFRRELAERIIPNRGGRRDGMPGYAFGVPGPLARLAPAVIRRFDLGGLRARADRTLARACPALAVIGTDADEPRAWMAAGQAMSNVLLRATADGLASSFLSQPVEVAELRPKLADLLDHRGFPQLLVRLGYGRPVTRPAPRRPVEEVLVEVSGDHREPAVPLASPDNERSRKT